MRKPSVVLIAGLLVLGAAACTSGSDNGASLSSTTVSTTPPASDNPTQTKKNKAPKPYREVIDLAISDIQDFWAETLPAVYDKQYEPIPDDKLYAATVKTLGAVFPGLDLYPTGLGEVIAVATAAPLLDRDALERKASALQERYRLRFPLPQILQRRMDNPRSQAASGDVITDDFAPADVYDVIGKDPRRRR